MTRGLRVLSAVLAALGTLGASAAECACAARDEVQAPAPDGWAGGEAAVAAPADRCADPEATRARVRAARALLRLVVHVQPALPATRPAGAAGEVASSRPPSSPVLILRI
jgi:hypothetical protein